LDKESKTNLKSKLTILSKQDSTHMTQYLKI